MKHLIIIGLLLISSFAFSQKADTVAPEIESSNRVYDLGMSVTVDSAKELESIITTESITQLAEMGTGDEKITFELICNYEHLNANVKLRKSYKVVGNTDNIDGLLMLIEKIKKSATNDYKNLKKS